MIIVLKYGDTSGTELLALPIMLGIMPLFNAIVDWLSLSVTRKFLYDIYFKHNSVVWVMGYVIIDVLLALFFMLVITSVLITVLALINSSSLSLAGKPALDLAVLMVDIRNPDKVTDMFWVHGMLLSTIMPTVIHFIFAIFALLSALLWRQDTINIERFYGDTHARFELLRNTTLSYIGTSILVVVLCLSTYSLLTHYTAPLLLLWDWANNLLALLDTSYNKLVY
jgi:hypothetical protein